MTNIETAPCQQKKKDLFEKINEAIKKIEETIIETKGKLSNGQYEKHLPCCPNSIGGQRVPIQPFREEGI